MNKLHFLFIVLLIAGCTQQHSVVDRYSLIPGEVVKKTPETDMYPPILISSDYEEPVPLPYPVNTRGGEDSPFITPDGKTLYFFFTPDVSKPVQKQVIDGVTGVYKSTLLDNGTWTEPERLWLAPFGVLSLDGCQFVQDNIIWVCSAREGYEGLHWFSAEYYGREWTNFELIDFPESYRVGELHVNNDWSTVYYHSDAEGGKGGYDLYETSLVNSSWSEPVNLEELNTEFTEGWPYLSEDEQELWFLRWTSGSPAIYRSISQENNTWSVPELIIQQFAAEPSLDNEGNIYFAHHFIEDGVMLDADIYVAYKK
ncbi:MAG: PD40 domain-containing protein [Nanoarchaeota archaeon]|nr:PD40 domain-containing protein [Nanoarchaeota archaeon]